MSRVSLIGTCMLRKMLEQMTANTRVDQHEAMLADISRTCPNTIRVLHSPHPRARYTCMMHAFDFTERPEYVAIAKLNVWAGADFAHWLLDGRLHPVARAKVRAHDLVFYLPEGRFKHVGLWTGSRRVISKWGTGLLYNHKPFEGPASYGDDVCYFKHVPYNYAWQLFATFAEENGIRFQTS
jgi:hypothetical protein